jgi:hypothetical protein
MARPDHVVSELVERAYLAADLDEDLFDTVVGVSLNGTGKVVVGAAGQTGTIGVLVPTKWLSKAGAQVDIHKFGDIVDITGLAAGTRYWVAADGTLTATEAAGLVYAGHTVEADRLVLSGFSLGVSPAAEEA